MTVLDPGQFDARLATLLEQWHPGSLIAELLPLEGGKSSLTYLATVKDGPADDPKIVVKVAPPGLEPVRNRDVLRQARVLHTIGGARGVRVPRVLFEDAGAPPEVPPLFAMSYLAGSSYEPTFDVEADPPSADVLHERARAASRMLAAVHALRPDAIGLGDEPEGHLDAEVARWKKSLDTVDEDLRPRADELHAALLAKLPAPIPTSIVHGDYRLGNLLCVGGDVAAIIDWEIWSRTDPRIDLGWFLMFAKLPHDPRSTVMPTPRELLEEYEVAPRRCSPRDGLVRRARVLQAHGDDRADRQARALATAVRPPARRRSCGYRTDGRAWPRPPRHVAAHGRRIRGAWQPCARGSRLRRRRSCGRSRLATRAASRRRSPRCLRSTSFTTCGGCSSTTAAGSASRWS